MKIPAFLLFICFLSLNAFSQKDKTLNWKVEELYGGRKVVTTKSRASGDYHFEAVQIIATKNGLFRCKVTPSQNSSLQIKLNAATVVNENTSTAKNYELNVKIADTLTLYFIGAVDAATTAEFYYEYAFGAPVISDTAKIVLNKNPKKAFEQLLAEARFSFVHLFHQNEKNKNKDIEFPNGLFFNKRALKDRQWVTQYTGQKVTKAVADKTYADWNKKITTWLKDYKITKVTQTGDQFNTETNYIKLSPSGYPLFKVTVFIIEEENFYCGVKIFKM